MSRQGFIVQGQPANTYEYNFAQVLNQYKIPYRFQVPFFGGRMRGGQVIDFIVYKGVRPIPVYIQSYWHTGHARTETQLKVMQFEQATQGQYDRPVEIWQADTLESATREFMEKIGV